MEPQQPPDLPSDRFVTTRWTRVLASHGGSDEARSNLKWLCETYYAPVAAYLRHTGSDPDRAREQTHAFFEGLLRKGDIGQADPGRGRFRSYLLGALKHFLSNQADYHGAQKRGGQAEHIPIEPGDEFEGHAIPSFDEATVDIAFDREWAWTLVESALDTLREENGRQGRQREFEVLKGWLSLDRPPESQSRAAKELGLSETAIKVAVHRLRKRFREIIRERIAETLHTKDEIDAEMRHLVAALASGPRQPPAP